MVLAIGGLCGCQVLGGAGDFEFEEGGSGPSLTAWARSFGDESRQSGNAVAVDVDDSVVVAGHFAGTIDFGLPAPLVADGFAGLLLRYDKDGSPQQGVVLGDIADIASDVVIAADGSIYVVGLYSGEFSIGLETPLAVGATQVGVFLAKFDSAFGPLWAVPIGPFPLPPLGASLDFFGAGAIANPALAIGPDGPVVAMELRGPVVTLGSTSTTNRVVMASGAEDMLVAQYAADGTIIWHTQLASSLEDPEDAARLPGYYRGLDTMPNGDVVVAGTFVSSLTAGTLPPIVCQDDSDTCFVDGYLARLERSSGNPLFLRRLGGAAQLSNLVGVGGDGRIYVGGIAFGVFSVQGSGATVITESYNPIPAYPASEISPQYVIAFDDAGNYLAHRAFPATTVAFEDISANGFFDISLPMSVDTAPNGEVLLSGLLGQYLETPIGALQGAGQYDVYVVKMTPDLEPVVASRFGDAASDIPLGGALDSVGHILVTGSFDQQLPVGDDLLQETGATSEGDGFVMKLLP
jgi:hypothetical protein